MTRAVSRRSLVAGSIVMAAGQTMPAAAQRPHTAQQTEGTSEECNCVCPKIGEREGSILLEGRGTRLSEEFELEGGRYRLELEFIPDDPEYLPYAGVVLYFPDGDHDLVYSAADAEAYASTLVRVPTSGSYLLEVEGQETSWKIALSPL